MKTLLVTSKITKILLLQKGRDLYIKLLLLKENPYFRNIFTLIILIVCSIYIYQNYGNLVSLLLESNWNTNFFVIALSAYFVCVVLGIFSWQLIIKGLGYNISLLDSAVAQCLPILSKYLPGSVWPYLGRGYITSQIGIPIRIVGIGFFYEFIQILISAFCFVLIFAPIEEFRLFDFSSHRNFYRGLGIGLLILDLSILYLIKHLLVKTSFGNNIKFKVIPLFGSFLIYLFAWIFFGISLWSTIRTLFPLAVDQIGFITATFAVSYVVGLLFLIAPNGLGVRDSMMILLLSVIIPNSQALIAAILSRLVIFLGDALGSLLGLILKKLELKGKNHP